MQGKFCYFNFLDLETVYTKQLYARIFDQDNEFFFILIGDYKLINAMKDSKTNDARIN